MMKKVRCLMVISSVLLIFGLISLPLLSRRPTLGRPRPLTQSYTKEAVNSSNGRTSTKYSTSAQKTEVNIPFMGNYNCSDDICSQFLISAGKNRCTGKSSLNLSEIEQLQQNIGKCHFMNGSYRAPVGLISFTGSGNTWLRGLLEKATGICTGSVYCDVDLIKGGFIGEGFKSGVVLVVKTHLTHIVWRNDANQRTTGPPWGAVILIIRNPLDALVAEWNRAKSTSHVATTGMNYFGSYKEWGRFVIASIFTWKQYFISLVQNGIKMNRPFLIIRYEDIKSDAFSQVKKIMNFLNIPVSDQLLQARLTTTYETFHRKQSQQIEHYTPQQRKQVLKVIQEVANMLQKEINDTFGITDYINGAM